MDKDIPDNFAILAGKGQLPLLACQEARKKGVKHIFVLAFKGQTDIEIEKYADEVDWQEVGKFRKILKSLKKHNIKNVFLLGQINPGKLFKGLKPDFKALKMLWRLKIKNAQTLFDGVIEVLREENLEVLPSTLFLKDHLATKGLMGKKSIGLLKKNDFKYGYDIAKKVSALDIGQTVVVKKGVLLAVEGFEGTDKAILRGGELGRGGVTVVKVAKKNHDMRFDVPCIGKNTIEVLKKVKAVTLAIEAEKTILINKKEIIRLCNKEGIVLIGL